MSDRHPEIAAAAASDSLRSLNLGHSGQSSATVAQSASALPASTAAAAAATGPVASAIGDTATAAPTATSSASNPIASSGAEIVSSTAAANCAPTPAAAAIAATVTATATDVATQAGPSASQQSTVGAAPPAAASSFSSSSSSSFSSTAPSSSLKQCARCHRLLPDGDYSGAQITTNGNIQCKVCVAGLKSSQNSSQSSSAEARRGTWMRVIDMDPLSCGAVAAEERPQVRNASEHLSGSSGPRELELLMVDGLRSLVILLQTPGQLSNSVAHEATQSITNVLLATQDPLTNQIRGLALACVALMARRPTLLVRLLVAGAVPVLLQLLQSRDPPLTANDTIWIIDAVATIAQASRSNCDALLAAGAMAVLLPLVTPNISARLRNGLLRALAFLMRGRPEGEMRAAVIRLATVLMDKTSPPELLHNCLNALDVAVIGFVDDGIEDPQLKPLVESILSAAPGFPQRLVDLLGNRDRPEVTDAAMALVVNMFKVDTDQLRQLFDCLVDKLLPQLNNAGGEQARLHAVILCCSAANSVALAPLLVDSAPVVERLLALLSSSEGETPHLAAGFFVNVLGHRDRTMTRRLVEEHRALPPFVAALRRAISSGDQTVAFRCLHSIANVLAVGDVEAKDDDRGINPYIEPLDFQLGAFELVKPLQKHSDAMMAETATFVFSYFIPNNCE